MDDKSNNQMELFDYFEGGDTKSADTESEDMFPEEMEDFDFNMDSGLRRFQNRNTQGNTQGRQTVWKLQKLVNIMQ